MRRVVITGVGAISPIGNNANDMWTNAKAGVCGIDEITRIDTTNFKVKLGAEIKNYNELDYFDKKEIKRMARFTKLAVVAAREAVANSGITKETYDPFRIGVDVATGIGGLDVIEAQHTVGQAKTFDRISPFFIPMTIVNMASGAVAIEHGFQGPCISVVTACASGTNAIGESFRQIRDGYADAMVAGGTESTLTEMGIGGFTAMRALSESKDKTRASIPFDKERDGFVMGEGSGVIVMEEYEMAKARGANIIAEVVGYATTCDASHITAPLEDGSAAAKCMELAIKDAKINKEDIDYINAHGTSTPLNDKGETKAISLAFGDHAQKLMVSSTKSMTGHLLGAAGGVEAIFCAKALQEGFVPPTIGYKEKDEECYLDIVPNVGRKADINYALSNSLGFGGHNACIILKKYQNEV